MILHNSEQQANMKFRLVQEGVAAAALVSSITVLEPSEHLLPNHLSKNSPASNPSEQIFAQPSADGLSLAVDYP
jgi:hypothetical protein